MKRQQKQSEPTPEELKEYIENLKQLSKGQRILLIMLMRTDLDMEEIRGIMYLMFHREDSMNKLIIAIYDNHLDGQGIMHWILEHAKEIAEESPK